MPRSLKSNSERKRERERERERGAATKLGRKEKEESGRRMEERKERKGVLGRISQEQCWLSLPLSLPPCTAERSFEKNNPAICGICYVVRRPSPLLSLSPARSLARSSRGAKSETIKRGEICGVKGKAEAVRQARFLKLG